MKIKLLPIFIILFAASAFSQTVKTDAARALFDNGQKIASLEKRINESKAELVRRRDKYTEENKAVAEERTRLESLEKELLALAAERARLEKQQLSKEIPNSDVGLLRLIVTQNERIIDLLERLVTSSSP